MATNFTSLVTPLWCLHWTGARVSDDTAATLRTSGVVLDTCLRQLAFGLTPRPALAHGPAGDASAGLEAYRLLLEVTSGLRSAVPGETNVSGQFRRAWEASAPHLSAEHRWHLQPVVHALQADTRALRASHLQGMAGGSYGSLVRELLAPRRDARVLFVGTGNLARSMLPLFRAWEVGAWNRRGPDQGGRAPLAGINHWFASADADGAAAWATDLVFTTPADPAHDAMWLDKLRQRPPRSLVHLGRRRSDRPAWPGLASSFDLDDVFDLASARDQHRGRQLATALRACAALVDARVAGTPARFARPLHAVPEPRLASA